MNAWTCPICERSLRQATNHLVAAHGAVSGGRAARSDMRLWLAVAFADEVAASRIADDAISGERPTGMHVDDRLAAAVLCIRRGHRSVAVMRLGVNGQTSQHMRYMVDNDLLPEVGSYELPPGVNYIDNDKESA